MVFTLFAAISQVSTHHLCAWGPCVGACWAMALIADTKQATSEGEVETRLTGLTGPGAMALKRTRIFSKKSCPKCHGEFTRLRIMPSASPFFSMNLLISVQCPTTNSLIFTPWPLPSSYHQLPPWSNPQQPPSSLPFNYEWRL